MKYTKFFDLKSSSKLKKKVQVKIQHSRKQNWLGYSGHNKTDLFSSPNFSTSKINLRIDDVGVENQTSNFDQILEDQPKVKFIVKENNLQSHDSHYQYSSAKDLSKSRDILYDVEFENQSRKVMNHINDLYQQNDEQFKQNFIEQSNYSSHVNKR